MGGKLGVLGSRRRWVYVAYLLVAVLWLPARFRNHGNSHEGLLRAATGRKGSQHSKFLFCNELVDIRICHA